MSLKKDIIGAEVQIGSNEAQKSLTDLAQKTSTLANENDRLRITQAKLKALGKEHEEEYKKITKTISENSKQIKDNNAQMDALRKTIGITEMSTKQLSKRALELRRELSGMSQSSDPERFKQLNKELIDTERQMRKNKSAIGETKGEVNTLADQAKQLLPAFGWAAIAAGAIYAFNQIKNSTDTLSTQWEVFIGGLNSGINEFWRTLATGDWSNLIDNMKEAVRVGREYAAMIDDIEEITRALSIQEAEAREKELELELKLKNKGLSADERIKAGKERIQLEEELQANRIKVAQEAFDAELMIATQQTKLSKERLIEIVRDMDSETKIKAKAYNKQLALIETLRAANKTVITTAQGSVMMQNADTPQIKQLQQQIEAVSGSVKIYAEELRKTGNTTDVQLDKMVGKYVTLKEAQNSAVENTMRVRTLVNTLLAGEDNGGKKQSDIEKQEYEKALEILDKANNERMATLIARNENEGWEESRFRTEMLSEEQAYLELKLVISQKYNQQTADIEKRINEKRIEAQKSLVETLNELEKELGKDYIREESEQNTSVSALIEETNAAINFLNKAKTEEQQILEERKQNYLDFAVSIGESFGQLMSDSEATFGDYLANTINLALEAFHQFFLIEKYKTIISNIGKGPLGWLSGAAEIAAMELAYQGAKSLITNSLSSKGKKSGGYSSSGSDNDIDGFYHKNEFIASAPAVRNPTVKPVLDIIDLAQRSGTISRLNLTSMFTGRQTGGYSSSSNQYVNPSVTQSIGLSPSDIKLFSDAVAEFKEARKDIDIVTVRKLLDEYDLIQKNRGL